MKQSKHSSLIAAFLFSAFCLSQNCIAQTTTDSSATTDTSVKVLTAKQEKQKKNEELRNIAPSAGKALVYIIRPTIMAFAIPMRVDCDSFQMGWISAKTFLYTMLDPGAHTFKCLAENEFHLDANLEAGKIYYYEEQVKMGFAYARTKLKLLTEEEGKKKLEKCTISGSNRYPKFPLSKDLEREPPKD
ncbi:MAG TPA: hypothetical protein VKT28_16455 [Puia sp.]|nr:hypothetical protein [Puia sp.]